MHYIMAVMEAGDTSTYRCRALMHSNIVMCGSLNLKKAHTKYLERKIIKRNDNNVTTIVNKRHKIKEKLYALLTISFKKACV